MNCSKKIRAEQKELHDKDVAKGTDSEQVAYREKISVSRCCDPPLALRMAGKNT